MGTKRTIQHDDTIVSTSLLERLESNIRHLPTSINKKLIDSFGSDSYLGHYLHLFEPEAKEAEKFINQCPALKTVYLRLLSDINQETFVGDWFEVNQQCIDQFAKATGDNQWIHTDPERAKQQSPFKTTISQGFLTLALIPKLTNSIDPDNTIYPEAKMVVNYGMNRVSFPYPLKVGKRIRARTRVTKLVPLKRGLEIVREVRMEIEKSSRPACIAETVLRLYFE
jgi:acyl dehydratase